MSKDNEKISERVDKLSSVNFSICRCPLHVYERFVTVCKNETDDNYAMGLKFLLDAKETNMKELVLYEHYMLLKQEVSDLRAEIALLKANPPTEEMEEKKAPKTFGKKH